MEISFDPPRLERLAPGWRMVASQPGEISSERAKVARRKLGDTTAKKLYERLRELAAAANVDDLVAGDPHEYSGEETYSLDLGRKNRLLFRPTHQPAPKTKAGNTDWKRVTSVTIFHMGPHRR
ncbi:MAG: killer suppression protein HigA [Deltaproteobacteria bacterium]|nr:killer suppression protein HigA [Deltaproteobacteria bacterium]